LKRDCQASTGVGHDGVFVAVEPSAVPAAERGVTIHVVVTKPDGARLELLDATTRGHLPARVHAVLPWTQAATADRELAKVGIRCRYVLHP
jgi:hypothetical protein